MSNIGENSKEYKDITEKIIATNAFMYENAVTAFKNDEKWREVLEKENKEYAKEVFNIIEGYFNNTVKYLVELYRIQAIHLCNHCLKKHLNELKGPLKDEDDFIFVNDYPECVVAKYTAYLTEFEERILDEDDDYYEEDNNHDLRKNNTKYIYEEEEEKDEDDTSKNVEKEEKTKTNDEDNATKKQKKEVIL